MRGWSLSAFFGTPLGMAVCFTGAGVAGLGYAFLTRRDPLALLPGLDGTLVCGVLALLMLMAAGRTYREAVTALVPIAAVQVAVCTLSRTSLPALLGLEALVVGLVGLALSACANRAAQQRLIA
ncbi:MAG: hypothetical protein AAGN82_15585 [Myxococcota bacterium]